jgi:predicted TIM-barrel fold metal-dependent hydrolase
VAELLEKILSYAGEKGTLVQRGEMTPREISYELVSVDDHLTEPPDMFVSRVPGQYSDRAPRVERNDAGADFWVFEEERVPLLGSDSMCGWEPGHGYLGQVNFDELHPAVYNIHERVKHMDVIGLRSSLTFPSAPFGFAGTRFLKMRDADLALASFRAFNDWILEEWAGPYPGRIIPCQLPWLRDPQQAADEIRANAARGFTSVSFSENPEKLGLPSLYSGEWDPFFAACVETGTILNLHVGSSSETLVPSKQSPPAVLGALFPINAMASGTDWLFSGIPMRFPDIKIVLSEGGIGWIGMLIDRIEYMGRDLDYSKDFGSLSPVDVLRRNFWFTTFCDPSTLPLRHLVGSDHIMVETDYPHIDSSWPDTQDMLRRQFAGIGAEEIELMTHRNAEQLYRLPTGPAVATAGRTSASI